MLNVVCINAGNYCKRGKEYVEILFDSIRRNLPEGYEGKFICFTDDVEPYAEGIEKRPLPCPELKGWWHKLSLFKPGLFDIGDRVAFFDLDTVITGGIEHILDYRGPFAILRDVYRPDGLQSSIMLWEANKTPAIWETFEAAGYPEIEGGDQAFLEKFPECFCDKLQDLFPEQIRSYKESCVIDIPPRTKIVVFHGLPRPHECEGNWVPYVWKIGGGAICEQKVVANVPEESLLANVKHALTLPHELLADQYLVNNDLHLAIVGGGPSLAETWQEVKQRQEHGQIIWALNNAFVYLVERGVYPDAHLMLDARPENAPFVPEKTNSLLLYATQCHPDTFAKAEQSGGKIVMWNRYMEGMLKALGNKRVAIIDFGTSVGMNALVLARYFGFKHLHLYGYDSSYKEDDNHAYKQPLNDGERIIDVLMNGETFKCAPWMAVQANEFRESVPDFVKQGVDFTVHGYGLIPRMAQLMQGNQ